MSNIINIQKLSQELQINSDKIKNILKVEGTDEVDLDNVNASTLWYIMSLKNENISEQFNKTVNSNSKHNVLLANLAHNIIGATYNSIGQRDQNLILDIVQQINNLKTQQDEQILIHVTALVSIISKYDNTLNFDNMQEILLSNIKQIIQDSKL